MKAVSLFYSCCSFILLLASCGSSPGEDGLPEPDSDPEAFNLKGSSFRHVEIESSTHYQYFFSQTELLYTKQKTDHSQTTTIETGSYIVAYPSIVFIPSGSSQYVGLFTDENKMVVTEALYVRN